MKIEEILLFYRFANSYLMKRLLLLFLLFLFAGFSLHAENEDWNVNRIPEKLKKNSDCVVRCSLTQIKVKGSSKSATHYKRVYTVLNEKGFEDANFEERYDKFSPLSGIKGRILNAEGKEIRKIKSSEFKDLSAMSGAALYEDNRVVYFELSSPVCPVTVEYEWEENDSGILSYGIWDPVPEYNSSVEMAVLSIELPAALPLRYNVQNSKLDPVKEEKEGVKKYTWTLADFEAIEKESFSPPANKVFPLVRLDPDEFDYDHTKGNISNWKELGKRMYELFSARQSLPPEMINQMSQIKSTIPDPIKRINAVQQILKEKVRYVSVQKGIGGWVPIPAETVDQCGYGDCKALTNYACALLKQAGIESYPVMIHAETPCSILPDYSSMTQTNHIILGIPNAGDTLFMECTNPLVPVGYMGNFTDNRLALMYTPEGGKLIRTPLLSPKDNCCMRKSDVKMNVNGELDVTAESCYRGYCSEDLQDVVRKGSKDQNDHFLEDCALQSPEIVSLQYVYKPDRIPEVDEKVSLKTSTAANVSGQRIFMTPLLFQNKLPKLIKKEHRITPVDIRHGKLDQDQYTISLPEGYKPEALPEAKNIQSLFGSYELKVDYVPGKINLYRSLILKQGEFTSTQYDQLIDFFSQVNEADQTQVVLVKN